MGRAGADGERRGGVAVVAAANRTLPRKREPRGPGDGLEHVLTLDQVGDGAPVLEARPVVHPHRHLTGEPLHATDQHLRWVHADVVPARAGLEGERVGERDLPLRGAEDGPQHQGVLQVAAFDSEVGLRPDRPVPGIVVEQPPEHRRGVEPARAPPVHRARGVHQRRAAAVGEETVVADLSALHLTAYPGRPAHAYRDGIRRGGWRYRSAWAGTRRADEGGCS